ISGSTWMKLKSPVASANAWIRSWRTSIHDDGPNSAPTSMAVMPARLDRCVAGLHGLGNLADAPCEERRVPHDLTVGERELPANPRHRVRAERVLPKLRARLVERKVAVHVHVLIRHENRAVEIEEQEPDH